MKRLISVALIAVAAASLSGCGAPVTNIANTNTNTNTGGGPAAPVTVEALKALEVKAFEAYKNKDTKYFETFLDRNFVSYDGGKKHDKAAALKMIGEHKDDIKGFTFSEEKLTKLGPVTAVFTMKAVTDGTTADGKKIPDVISSTLYVRLGTEWKAAWHGEVPILAAPGDNKADAKPKADDKTPAAPAAEKKAADAKPANSNAANTANTAAPSAPLEGPTDALMKAETAGWEAWKAKDWGKIGSMMTTEVVFVDPAGIVTVGRDANIKNWTDMDCKISSVSVTDGSSILPAGATAVLFAKGNPSGTCGGEKVGPVWVTAIYVQEGSDWKLAYHFENLAG